MEFEPLKLALYTWFSETSGITTIWSEQSGPRPKRPYATLKVVSGAAKIGGEDNLRQASSGRFVLNGPRTFALRCQVYGENALTILNEVRDSLDDPLIVEQLDESGIAIVDDGNPSDITEALETYFEQRAVLDVMLQINTERPTKVGSLAKVGINGQNIGS